MQEFKTNPLTLKDVHTILRGENFHRELTHEEKEQIEAYKKRVEAFSQHFIENIQATLESSPLLSIIADAQKSAQAFSQKIAPFIESQNKIINAAQCPLVSTNSIVETVENAGLAMMQVQEKVSATFEALRGSQRGLIEDISNSSMSVGKILNVNFLNFPSFTNIFNLLNDSGNYFRGMIDTIKNIGSNFMNIINFIQEQARAFIEPFFLLNKSNFFLVLHASKGDTIALHQLGKLWWKLLVLYTEVEKRKGRKPTKKEFHSMVQVACWEVIQQSNEKQIPLFELARTVYYFIIGKLLIDYVEVVNTTRLDENINLEIVAGQYKSSITPYYDNQNKPNFFVRTVAEEIGVTSQTIRNWIKAGKVSSVRTSYYSKIKKALIPAYLLPYEINLMADLKRIKQEQESKKRHRLNGYFTISQLSKEYGLSRKTFERWEKENKLVPLRINNIRYYTEEQKQTIPDILLRNNSPKIRALLSSPRLALA